MSIRKFLLFGYKNARRNFYSSLSVDRRFQVAVVGSGPAGFYSAGRLAKNSNVQVDIYEKLPVPFGLVRFGVAPDHPEVKSCINRFEEIAQYPNCRFVGNCSFGTDVTVDDLLSNYDAVILAYGAQKDKALDIKGENLQGVFSGMSFVGWYNGHPDYADLDVDLSHPVATVVGNGNVALDMARILLTPVSHLKKTDISRKALATLEKSKVEKVIILGRRGPLQVAFTIKELREMTVIPNCFFQPFQSNADLIQDIQTFLSQKEIPRPQKRLQELLLKILTQQQQKVADASSNEKYHRSWELRFLRSPHEIVSSDGNKVSGIICSMNNLDPITFLSSPSGKLEEIETGLILRSIGYKSVSVPGIPFDSKKNIVPNQNGFVVKEDGAFIRGLFVTGWLKTGPVGVIATTMMEAFNTADQVNAFLDSLPETTAQKRGYNAVDELLKKKGLKSTSFSDWKYIDDWEKKQGELEGIERKKIESIEDMLKIIQKQHVTTEN